MRNLISKTFILFLLLITSLNAVNLDWIHDFDKALAKAKKEHKTVYLFIGADECKYCDRFYKNTLSNKKVIADMRENFVLVYMSRDQHKIPDGLEKYGVPRHYFFTEDGKLIHSDQGSREIAGWYDVLDEVDLKLDN